MDYTQNKKREKKMLSLATKLGLKHIDGMYFSANKIEVDLSATATTKEAILYVVGRTLLGL